MTKLVPRNTGRRPGQEFSDPESLQVEMDQWLRTPLGEALLKAEHSLLEPIISRIFGYHILQIACSRDRSLLNESPIAHKIAFAPTFSASCTQARDRSNDREGNEAGQSSEPGVDTTGRRSPEVGGAIGRAPVADNEALPLISGSVDAVLMHHALDFTPNSHRLLREAARVVMPGGRLLIIGFNPISFWGLSRAVRRRRTMPWQGRFISSMRVIDWLKLLQFHVEKVSYAAHFLPLNYAGITRHADRFEKHGARLNSPLGAVYLIVASKQVIPITPVIRRWPRLRNPVIVMPVAKRQSQSMSQKTDRSPQPRDRLLVNRQSANQNLYHQKDVIVCQK